MNAPAALSLAVLLSLSAGCNALDPVACTLEARAGINVTVVDDAAGTSLADGASLVISEGEWNETVTDAFGGTLSGAWERPGSYALTVARDGYRTWSRTDVVVTADECHVIPVTLEARLQAAASP